MDKQAILKKLASEIVNNYLIKLAAEEVEKKKKDDIKRKIVNAIIGVSVPTALTFGGLAAYDKFLDIEREQSALAAEKERNDAIQAWSMLLNPRRWAEAAQQSQQ